LTGYQTLEEYQGAFASATTKLMSDISAAMATYQENLKTTMETCGLSVEDFGKQLNKILNGEDGKGGIKQEITNLGDETTGLVNTVSENVSNALSNLSTFYKDYAEKIAIATGET
jgi:hypothetical protein